jgi:uncharacterized protein
MTDTALPNSFVALSDVELDVLDEFLAIPALEETSMDVAVLDGYLTALLVSPQLVIPAVWMARIWDMENAQLQPHYRNAEEQARIDGLIKRHYQTLAAEISKETPALVPVFLRGAQWGISEWCAGFLLGTSFDRDTWAGLMEEQPEWFTALNVLGMGDDDDIEEEFEDVDAAFDAVMVAVQAIDRHFRAERDDGPDPRTADFSAPAPVLPDAPKTPRNALCPCGSGKKFKKCCGHDARVTN